MSDFWAKKLGAPTSAPRPAPPVPRTPPETWWQPPPATPAPAPLPEGPATSPKAMSSRETERCPNPACNSGNYMTPPGTQSKKRCYDCGYPLIQSGSGASLPSGQGGDTAAARQLDRVQHSTYSGAIIQHL